ncbi:MAG TPA: hypothetical protein VE172_22575 [Stackebrandtia sp.]|uniref:hypothetical protein n=1 Tax=Stackebrandtia sp. TaxID=2023065 RepID=UPI002D269C55|nr:hypothetical protein [Stackebrandtia sp.]HZE41595.1 hypothetical protein [Stackebrandtia sp.]
MSQPEPTSDVPASPPQPSFAVPFPQQQDPASTQFTVVAGFAATAPARPPLVSAATALMAVECLVGLVFTASIALYSFGVLGPGGGYVDPDAIVSIIALLAAVFGYVALTVFVFLGRDGARITTFGLSGLLSGLGLFGGLSFLFATMDAGGYYPYSWLDMVAGLVCAATFLLTVAAVVLLGLGPSARWFAQLRDARSKRL